MRQIEIRLESERGKWEIVVNALLSKGANASVYRANIATPASPSLITDLTNMGLLNDLVLRLLDSPDPLEEDKAVTQFEHFAAAWDKLSASSVRDRFMEPIFCESRGRPPYVPIRVNASITLPKVQMKKGDAIFSLKEGEPVWKLASESRLPPLSQWRGQLLNLVNQVCSNGLHYRDWHSQNVLLNQLSASSWEINVIDPGALVEIERVIWESAPQRHKFDKYEIGVSIMGIQDLIWIAVRQIENDFYDEIKEVLTHPNRQLLMPKIIDKR